MKNIDFFAMMCEQAPDTLTTQTRKADFEEEFMIQLAVLGSNENRTTNPIIGTLFGVSNDHGNDCTEHVIEALYLVRHDWIRWPDAAARRREDATNQERKGF